MSAPQIPSFVNVLEPESGDKSSLLIWPPKRLYRSNPILKPFSLAQGRGSYAYLKGPVCRQTWKKQTNLHVLQIIVRLTAVWLTTNLRSAIFRLAEFSGIFWSLPAAKQNRLLAHWVTEAEWRENSIRARMKRLLQNRRRIMLPHKAIKPVSKMSLQQTQAFTPLCHKHEKSGETSEVIGARRAVDHPCPSCP
jgi:hypothetical protein